MLGLWIFSPLWVSLIAFNSTPVLLSLTYSCISSSPSWSARWEKPHNWIDWGTGRKHYLSLSGMLELALTGCEEPIICIFSQLCFQWHRVGYLMAEVEIFTQWQLANITNRVSPLDLESQLLNIFEHTTAYFICLKFSSTSSHPPY